MKKRILVTVLGMTVVLAAGCGGNKEESKSSTSKEESKTEESISLEDVEVHETADDYEEELSEELEDMSAELEDTTVETEIIEMPVTFINNTGVDVYCLYASTGDTDEWEEDLLGDTMLEPGDYVEVDFVFSADETIWDFAIEDVDGNLLEFYDLDFEGYGSDGMTVSFNDDGTVEMY